MRGLLKKITSNRTRRDMAFALVKARRPTVRWRPLPNLLVIGAQRCGTSSLFKYLGAHPQCSSSIRKEVRFFSEYYEKGPAWYRAHFPMTINRSNGRRRVNFEATPDYMLDPRVPERAVRLLPEFQVIVLMRNPVERAYSQYWHNRRLGTETLPFHEALEREDDRIRSHLRALERGSDEPAPKPLLRYSYLERGRYAEQLARWLDFVDSDRVLVLLSEDFYRDTDHTFQRILSFVGLPEWRPPTYANFSYTAERPLIPPMPEDSRRRLELVLSPEVDRLKEIWKHEPGLFDSWGVAARA
jgi:hypothetical protein